jgi:arylsulfatase A
VKRIVQKINTSGIRRKTLIIFAGDNGTPQRAYSVMADGSIVKGGKSSSRTAGTNVPLIASLPGTIPQGVISDQLVDFTDFFPTLAAVGGAPLPNVVLDGYDLTGHLQDLSPSGRTFVFSWYPKLDGNLLIHARDDRYKLYDTGTFFDCWSDPEEKNQILNPTGAEQAVRDVLQLVLDDYALQGGGR